MANSLTVQGSLNFQAPAGSSTVNSVINLAATTAPVGSTAVGQIYNATTSQTQPTTPGVTSIGYVFFRNLDPTNFVQIAAESADYCLNLLPGDISLCKWNGNAIYMLANTANVAVQMIVFSL